MSGGFVNIHPSDCLTISNIVAGAPLESFSHEVQYAGTLSWNVTSILFE